jgi:hypothetical protein
VMVSNASLTESLRNAQINNGVAGFYVNREWFGRWRYPQFKWVPLHSMIDISHSMILYGEDDYSLWKSSDGACRAEPVTLRNTPWYLVLGMMLHCNQRFALFKVYRFIPIP